MPVNGQTGKSRPLRDMPADQKRCAENQQEPTEEKNDQHRFHSSNYSSRHARNVPPIGRPLLPRRLASPFGELRRSYAMLVPYFQVLAFTDRFLGGNPAGVCLLDADWPAA